VTSRDVQPLKYLRTFYSVHTRDIIDEAREAKALKRREVSKLNMEILT
jgi:hypothetical protein